MQIKFLLMNKGSTGVRWNQAAGRERTGEMERYEEARIFLFAIELGKDLSNTVCA